MKSLTKHLTCALGALMASAAMAQVTTITDPAGALLATVTPQGYQTVVTNPQGQVTAVITPPPPSNALPPITSPTISSPVGQNIFVPPPPPIPVIVPYSTKWGTR